MSDWPLKPCPFCGKPRNQYITSYSGVYATRCTCGAEAPPGDTEDEAAENWNRRPDMILIPEGVDMEAVREALEKLAEEPLKLTEVKE